MFSHPLEFADPLSKVSLCVRRFAVQQLNLGCSLGPASSKKQLQPEVLKHSPSEGQSSACFVERSGSCLQGCSAEEHDRSLRVKVASGGLPQVVASIQGRCHRRRATVQSATDVLNDLEFRPPIAGTPGVFQG